MNPRPESLAIVTGATAGIGLIFAERLARLGHPLLLIARDDIRLRAVADRLAREHNVRVSVEKADLSQEADIRRIAERLASEPEPGVLVNNAGFGTKGLLHNVDPDVQASMVILHTLAPMCLARAVLPAMHRAGRGWIINVSSVAGFIASPGNVNYSATKAYLIRFSEALATEMVGSGVVVQALCPGFTHTEFHDRARMDMRHVPSWLWLPAGVVVDASLRSARNGRPVVVIPGVRYRPIAALVRITPAWLIRWGSRVLKRDVAAE